MSRGSYELSLAKSRLPGPAPRIAGRAGQRSPGERLAAGRRPAPAAKSGTDDVNTYMIDSPNRGYRWHVGDAGSGAGARVVRPTRWRAGSPLTSARPAARSRSGTAGAGPASRAAPARLAGNRMQSPKPARDGRRRCQRPGPARLPILRRKLSLRHPAPGGTASRSSPASPTVIGGSQSGAHIRL
jgi:hypothetical protein